MRFLALVLGSLISKPLLACSVCGCDPSGGTLGLERPTSGDLRLAVEDRYLQKESGSVDDQTREGEREDRIGLRFQYSPPVPRLSFQIEVPLYAWKAHYGVNGLQDDTNQGLSDVALTGRYEVLHLGGAIPRHVVAVIGTLKAPTGNNSHLAAVDNGPVDEHKQIGTGTWDEMLGVWYSFGDFPTVVYAGVRAPINGSNGRLLERDAEGHKAGKDTIPGNTYDPNSGGFVGYATGTAGYAITTSLLVRGTLQVPVVTALNGVQSEHPVGYLALAYDFSL